MCSIILVLAYMRLTPRSVCLPLIAKTKMTPLILVAKYAKSPAIVDLLLEAEADVNAKDKVKGWEGDGVWCGVCMLWGLGRDVTHT